MGRLPRGDLVVVAEEIAHLIRAGEEHGPGERIDVEGQIVVTREVDDLGLEVDRQFGVRVAPDEVEQLTMSIGVDDDRQEAVLERVVAEDVGEAGRQDRPDAPRGQGPRRVFAR
jgi:hypothetical protein